jgi:threonine dehydrogenase-like Zn-dependent dehydrogenase
LPPAGAGTAGAGHDTDEVRGIKAVTWHGKRDVRVDEVPDPRIEQPTDAIVRITSTAICGSDLPLVTDDSDPLGVEDLATHQLPLEEAPRGYEIFQKKEDDAINVVLKP